MNFWRGTDPQKFSLLLIWPCTKFHAFIIKCTIFFTYPLLVSTIITVLKRTCNHFLLVSTITTVLKRTHFLLVLASVCFQCTAIALCALFLLPGVLTGNKVSNHNAAAIMLLWWSKNRIVFTFN